jgi:hypothetical protein
MPRATAGAAHDAAAHDAGAARSADAVRRLLLAQRDAVGASPDVAALGGHLPDASSVYVALRAGRVERAGAGRRPRPTRSRAARSSPI